MEKKHSFYLFRFCGHVKHRYWYQNARQAEKYEVPVIIEAFPENRR